MSADTNDAVAPDPRDGVRVLGHPTLRDSVEAAGLELVPFATVKQADPSNYVGTDSVVRSGGASSDAFAGSDFK